MHPVVQGPIRAFPILKTTYQHLTPKRLPTSRTPTRFLHNLRNPSILPQILEPSTAAKTLPLTNPSTNAVITRVPLTLPSSLPTLLPSKQVITQWRETPLPTRLSHLQSLHRLITAHAQDLAYLIHLEVGNPVSEALAEVHYALNLLSWCSQPALHSVRTTYTRHTPHHQTFSALSPVGPVLAISPFNLPLALAVRKLAPALAAGCTVLAKPSDKALLPTLALARLLEEAGLPKGVYTPIIGGGEVVTPLLAGDHVRMLSFTGSTTVGRMLQQQAGWRRCLLELGGNAPFIVFDDCDISIAAKDLVRNGLRCAGQTCISANRIFVQERIYDTFVAELAKRVRQVNIGPVIDENAKDMIIGRIRTAVDAGAKVVVGGQWDGCFVKPTVLTDVEDGMQIADEETFGPVFSVLKFRGEDEVVERANSRGGLAAYLYTKDIGTGMRMVDRINAGMIGLNSVTLSSGETDFGGMGQTGLGREGGLGAIEAYCERKFCVIES